MKQQILIAGGRTKAKSLALSLAQKGCSITILNKNADACQYLAESTPCKVICADATKPYVLEDLSSSLFDSIITLCPRDADNLMICRLAKAVFPGTRTISLVSDLSKKKVFTHLGADRVICAASVIATMIENEAFLKTVTSQETDCQTGLRQMQIDLQGQDAAVGRTLEELSFPAQTIVGCILRQDELLIPAGSTRLLSGDSLVILMRGNREPQLRTLLKGE